MSIPAQSKVEAAGGQSYKNHDQTQIRPWVACSCSSNIGGGRGPPKHSQILIVKSKTEEPLKQIVKEPKSSTSAVWSG